MAYGSAVDPARVKKDRNQDYLGYSETVLTEKIPDKATVAAYLNQNCALINEVLRKYLPEDKYEGGTTLSAAVILPDGTIVRAHLGDSPIYLAKKTAAGWHVSQLNKDIHNKVHDARPVVKWSKKKPNRLDTPTRLNMTRTMGDIICEAAGLIHEPNTNVLEAESCSEGDIVMVASDGMILSEAELSAQLNTLMPITEAATAVAGAGAIAEAESGKSLEEVALKLTEASRAAWELKDAEDDISLIMYQHTHSENKVAALVICDGHCRDGAEFAEAANGLFLLALIRSIEKGFPAVNIEDFTNFSGNIYSFLFSIDVDRMPAYPDKEWARGEDKGLVDATRTVFFVDVIKFLAEDISPLLAFFAAKNWWNKTKLEFEAMLTEAGTPTAKAQELRQYRKCILMYNFFMQYEFDSLNALNTPLIHFSLRSQHFNLAFIDEFIDEVTEWFEKVSIIEAEAAAIYEHFRAQVLAKLSGAEALAKAATPLKAITEAAAGAGAGATGDAYIIKVG